MKGRTQIGMAERKEERKRKRELMGGKKGRGGVDEGKDVDREGRKEREDRGSGS